MTEMYSLDKTMPALGIDINISVPDKELFLKLDETIQEIIIKHYGLGE